MARRVTGIGERAPSKSSEREVIRQRQYYEEKKSGVRPKTKNITMQGAPWMVFCHPCGEYHDIKEMDPNNQYELGVAHRCRRARENSKKNSIELDLSIRYVSNAKTRAKQKGLPVDREAIVAAIKRGLDNGCECGCGAALVTADGSGKRYPNTLEIDRISMKYGYVDGNVAALARRCNTQKQNNTLETLDRFRSLILRAEQAALRGLATRVVNKPRAVAAC